MCVAESWISHRTPQEANVTAEELGWCAGDGKNEPQGVLQHSGHVVVWPVFVLAHHTAESYSSPGVLLLANEREFVLLVQWGNVGSDWCFGDDSMLKYKPRLSIVICWSNNAPRLRTMCTERMSNAPTLTLTFFKTRCFGVTRITSVLSSLTFKI